MLRFKNGKDLENQIREGKVSTGDLDYMIVEDIEYKMKSYDEAGQEVIWEEAEPGSKNSKEFYGITLYTSDRYKTLEDAKIDEYYF